MGRFADGSDADSLRIVARCDAGAVESHHDHHLDHRSTSGLFLVFLAGWMGNYRDNNSRPAPLLITRSAESIRLDVPDPWYDGNRYVGSVVGQDFTATSGSFDGYSTCAGSPPTRSDWVWEGHVSGRFSSDGSSLTAREVWSYKFPTGDEATAHIDWTATKQGYEP